jgi:hypothetical protein
MASTLEELRAALSGDTVSEISTRIGADPTKTKTAIDQALPVLLGALGKEAADPDRRHGLRKAIEEDHDGSLVDDLGSYLRGEKGGRAANGSGILEHILGDQQQPAAMALSSKSGLDLGTIMSLLPMLAPIVMGMLGKKQRAGSLSFDNLAEALGGETKAAADESPDIGDLLGSVLGGGQSSGKSSGGIGDILGSIFGKR